ncbi:hypothetical protein [Ferroplasma sp.]|uniref:hypothetical protein n=1 Tax=Ferroplasma sp. TaxID=2591003 RepID=UPI00307E1290
MSKNIRDFFRKNSVLVGGIVFSVIMPIIFYSDNNILFLILAAVLGFGSSIIDYWESTYRKIGNIQYVYTGIAMVVIFAALYFTDIKKIYIIFALSASLIVFSIIFTLLTYQNTNYKKTLLIKKLKRYIISIGDIKRVRNSYALFYAISVNSFLYISVAIILISFPLIAIKLHAVNIIYDLIGISGISFFTIFLGNLIKSRLFHEISFVSIFSLFLLIGFIISIKDTQKDLTFAILFIPLITFMVPGYRKYISSKFPRSEIYYVNKFASFFSGISIILVPVIILVFIGFPLYAIIFELIASMIALMMCLKFINYPEIVSPRKT